MKYTLIDTNYLQYNLQVCLKGKEILKSCDSWYHLHHQSCSDVSFGAIYLVIIINIASFVLLHQGHLWFSLWPCCLQDAVASNFEATLVCSTAIISFWHRARFCQYFFAVNSKKLSTLEVFYLWSRLPILKAPEI